MLSKVGQPFVPSYVISKFAVRGLTEVLRSELAEEPDIHVCSLLPYAIDTPHFQSAANLIGKHPYALPPMQSPEKVARALVALVLHPRRERYVPRIAALGVGLHKLLPRTTERLLLRALRKFHFGDDEQPATSGNLYAPVETNEGEVHGQRPPRVSTPSFAAWTMRELARMEFDGVLRRMPKWARRAAAAAPANSQI